MSTLCVYIHASTLKASSFWNLYDVREQINNVLLRKCYFLPSLFLPSYFRVKPRTLPGSHSILRIQSECGKIRTIKNFVFGHFSRSGSSCEKLLGVSNDIDFTLEEQTSTLCRKASQYLHVLYSISQYLLQYKLRILSKTFKTSQFNYCPLAWMCGNRGLNNKIKNIHKRALRIVYQDKKSNLQDLLQKDRSASITWKTCNIWQHKSEK